MKKKYIVGYEVLIEKDGDSFHAYCPVLKGLHISGDTENDAVTNVKAAVMAYIKSSIKHGDPLPAFISQKEGG